MSDRIVDDLAEAARNRGLKLVRSRVRTPGKRRFGKVGLTDKAGKPVFGMDSSDPVAKPEDVADYLRNLGASDWGASLDVAVLPRKRKPTKVSRKAANDAEPANRSKPAKQKPQPKPEPQPKLKIRQARPDDAPRIVELICELGHEIDEKSTRKNLAKLTKAGEAPLVATLDKNIVGLVGRHVMMTVHRPRPVGRIPILVVTHAARGRKLGRMLVEAVEQWCRDKGCGLIEVTSNDQRASAHAFYHHLGYDRSSIRFFKRL